MEPYLVQCSSCKSKIRVRNPNLIGKSINCPKCSTPLLITPPTSPKILVSPTDVPSVDSTALTRDGFADDALSGLADRNPSVNDGHDVDAASTFSNFDFSEVDQVLTQRSQQDAAEQTMQYYSDLQTQSAGDGTAWQVPERAAPTEQWSSKSTAKSRQMLIVGFLGASSCLAAGLAFILFLRWYNAGKPIAQRPTNNTNQAEVASENGSTVGSVDGEKDQSSTSTEISSEADNNEPTTEPPKIVVDSNPGTSPADSTSNPGLSDSSSPDIKVRVDAESTAKTNQDITSSTQPAASEMPPKIRDLLRIVGEQPIPITDPEQFEVPDKPKVTELEIQTGASELKMTPAAKLNEMASKLQIWSLTMTQRKLHDVVSLWNSSVGLPVVVSTLSLAAADYDFSQRFDIELREVPASTGIEQLASKLGLKVESRENRFWLLYAPNPGEDKLPSKIKVDDLVTDAVQQQWLLETIELVFGGTSSGLSLEAGFLSSKADQLDRLTWFSIVRMLENWRRQAGLPAQVTGYRNENMNVPFVIASNMPTLDRVLDQVNSTSKPLAQLINQQCNSVDLNCWVDWPALEFLPTRLLIGDTRSITPQTPRISITFNRPLKNFLKELEFDLGIVSVLHDERTLILTSRFAYRRMSQVFVIPSQGKSIDGYWDQYFRPLTPIDSSGISNVVLRATPDGKYLIVKSCWPTLLFE